MLLDDKLDQLLKDLGEQWNIAERRIKKAEFVQGGEVVDSAIFELRYAGRKLIDAQTLVFTKDWRNDPQAYDDICRFLADAIEDCVKAKHDAIDAIVDFITNWFSEMESAVGLKRLTALFPEYIQVTATIANIQDKIARSRENRIDARDGVYDEIENEHYSALLDLYNKMRLSKERIQILVDEEDRETSSNFWLLLIPAIAAIVLVCFEIFKLVRGH